ncbi:MAG: ATP-binding protein [Oscillospiraceae bacterium]|nr:ATP-binding protein [Oscillospiraceae bacterium]
MDKKLCRPAKRMLRRLKKAAALEKTVVLYGASGSGKSLLAQKLCEELRAGGKTVQVCSARSMVDALTEKIGREELRRDIYTKKTADLLVLENAEDLRGKSCTCGLLAELNGGALLLISTRPLPGICAVCPPERLLVLHAKMPPLGCRLRWILYAARQQQVRLSPLQLYRLARLDPGRAAGALNAIALRRCCGQ